MTDLKGTVVILGAGGHARVLASFLTSGGHRVRGYVCPRLDADTVPDWLGEDIELSMILNQSDRVVNGIGSVGRPIARRRAVEAADAAGARFLNFVHPTAVVAPSASTDAGALILAGAILQPGCSLGRNVLINTAAVLEHDVRVGDHAHVAPSACLCGGVELGHTVHVGAGAIVLQGVKIGNEAVVGAGAVVTRSIPARATAVGNPARILEPSRS